MGFQERQDNLNKIILADSEESEKEFLRHIEIWNKMAEFIDYGILKAPNISRIPIYFNRRFPNGKSYAKTEEELFTSVENYNRIADRILTEYVQKYKLKEDWCPTIDFNQAKECEEKLMKNGRYNLVHMDKSWSEEGSMGAKSVGLNVITITYSGSMYNLPIRGDGINELEAVCDACIEFMNRKMKIENSKGLITQKN